MRTPILLASGLAVLGATPCFGSGIPTSADPLEEIVVHATRLGLVGESLAASEGIVPAAQIEGRPVLRPGEVLEVVPGLIVTQHSGDGKANQYFLRGFNLDHGTDFATRVDGVPINLPTHAHGQGYTDINFLIPELVDEVRYRKGTYFAESGNFSAAGAADVVYARRLDATRASVTVGEYGYRRALLAGSPEIAGGPLLFGFEASSADGPWELPQDYRKLNGILKYSREDDGRGFALTAMGYHGAWDSTDQIPLRAVDDGTISRFGYVDPTSGGKTQRISVAADAWGVHADGRRWRANAYAFEYDLTLVSNFTYAIDTVYGDQFEQFDDRRAFGGSGEYAWPLSVTASPGEVRAGVEARHDDIDPVGLYLTTGGQRRETVRQDQVQQASYGAYVAYEQHWNGWLRTEAGARVDYFEFDVTSDRPENSGRADDSIVSPKFTVALGPWAETEVFLNYGSGFHSNDARGTTISVDPVDGTTPVTPVDPLVSARGAEIGLRSGIVPGLQAYAAFWGLDIDSELLFVGDGGITEPSRASERRGIELGAFWTPRDWLIVDADLAWSQARFADPAPDGDRIPGAVESVASLGVSFKHPAGYFGGARLRYLGPAPLVEDDSVRSESTTLVNLEAGYRFNECIGLLVTVFNLFDSEENDITYYYESQLPGESAPVEDLHFHPVEPRSLRVTLTADF